MTELTAAVRSLVQAGISAGIAWLATRGVNLPPEVVSALTVLILGVVVAAGNWAGQKWPWINKVISLGLSPNSPTY